MTEQQLHALSILICSVSGGPQKTLDQANGILRTVMAEHPDFAASSAPVQDIPDNEMLESLWETTHYGHPADFGADVLERWGGWPQGLLGYGGRLAGFLAADPSAAVPPQPQGNSARVNQLEAAIRRALESLCGDYAAMALDLKQALDAAAPYTQPAPAHVEPMLVSALRNLQAASKANPYVSPELAKAQAAAQIVLDTYSAAHVEPTTGGKK